MDALLAVCELMEKMFHTINFTEKRNINHNFVWYNRAHWAGRKIQKCPKNSKTKGGKFKYILLAENLKNKTFLGFSDHCVSALGSAKKVALISDMNIDNSP